MSKCIKTGERKGERESGEVITDGHCVLIELNILVIYFINCFLSVVRLMGALSPSGKNVQYDLPSTTNSCHFHLPEGNHYVNYFILLYDVPMIFLNLYEYTKNTFIDQYFV